jgi:hypothetical protein
MAEIAIEWARGDGSPPITFGMSGPYYLIGFDGLSSTLAEPVTVKAPGAAGDRAYDAVIGGRTITMQIEVNSDDPATHWTDRRALARAFAVEPLRDAAAILEPGELRVSLGDGTTLALPALPRLTPADTNITPIVSRFDCELYAPDPYWRDLVERSTGLEEQNGFTFPLEHPFTMETNNASGTVENLGHVATPIVVRFYGELTGPRLTNETTGEAIEFSTAVPAGSYLEVSTAGGRKYAELVDGAGNRENRMADLNLAIADFLWLPPGESVLAFVAASNVSGSAVVTYRQRYAGV